MKAVVATTEAMHPIAVSSLWDELTSGLVASATMRRAVAMTIE